ncbi:MAG: hypothetical protein OPY03_01810 [Nitrosopumilus sp.]|nr:hypothetical protein [Nitrosopumilus sp.]
MRDKEYETVDMNKVRDLIEICICGHGLTHHNGKFAQCTCDVGQYKNEKLCLCPNYRLDRTHKINKKIIEWNDEIFNKTKGE